MMGHISNYEFTTGSEMQFKEMILVLAFPNVEDLTWNWLGQRISMSGFNNMAQIFWNNTGTERKEFRKDSKPVR